MSSDQMLVVGKAGRQGNGNSCGRGSGRRVHGHRGDAENFELGPRTRRSNSK